MNNEKPCVYLDMSGNIQESSQDKNRRNVNDLHLYELDAFLGSLKIASEEKSQGFTDLILALKNAKNFENPILKICWASDKKVITYQFEIQEQET